MTVEIHVILVKKAVYCSFIVLRGILRITAALLYLWCRTRPIYFNAVSTQLALRMCVYYWE
jgi:hypothetical protein